MKKYPLSVWVSMVVMAGLSAAILFGKDPEASASAATPKEWVKTELYLGRDLQGGHEISQREFMEFVDKVVSKQFPKGLTIVDAYGQMQHEDGRIERQSTWVLSIVHPKDPAIDKSIQDVVAAYRKQFNNPQVMHLSAPVNPRFYAD